MLDLDPRELYGTIHGCLARLRYRGLLRDRVQQRQLLGTRHQIVQSVEIPAELRHTVEHATQDELGGDQLADRQFAAQDQVSAEREQRRAGKGVEQQERDRLGKAVAEVAAVLLDIRGGDGIRTIHCEIEMAAGFVEAVRRAQALQPPRGVMLGVAERHRGPDRPPGPEEPDCQDEYHQQRVEREEERMVETGDDETDDGLQQDREPADDQARHGLLHHDEIEIAVEQVAAVLVGEERVLGMDRARRHLGHDARERVPLEQRHDPEPHRAETRDEQQQQQQQPRQRPERCRQRSVGDVVDQQLDRDRSRQRQETDRDAVDCGKPQIRHVRSDDLPEPFACLAPSDPFVCHLHHPASLQRRIGSLIGAIGTILHRLYQR